MHFSFSLMLADVLWIGGAVAGHLLMVVVAVLLLRRNSSGRAAEDFTRLHD